MAQLLHEYKDVFSRGDYDVNLTKAVCHEIHEIHELRERSRSAAYKQVRAGKREGGEPISLRSSGAST